MNQMKISVPGSLVVAALLLFGCSSQKDSPLNAIGLLALSGGQSTGLEGSVVKGPVRNARVAIYRIGNDGSLTGPVEETRTDSRGRFRFQHRYTGERIELVSESGEYLDEATGNTVTLQARNQFRLQLASSDRAGDVTLSPLTTMATARFRSRIEAGGGDPDALILQAREEIATMFGLQGIDPGRTPVDDLTDPLSLASRLRLQTRYGIVLAGMSQVLSDRSIPADMLPGVIDCYCADVRDGDIDGFDGANAVTCDASMGSLEMHQNMVQSMNAFMVSNRNQHKTETEGMDLPVPGF